MRSFWVDVALWQSLVLPIYKSEKCALLGYYADSSGNLLPTLRDNVSLPNSGLETTSDFWNYRLSRKAGKKLPLLSAQFSTFSRAKAWNHARQRMYLLSTNLLYIFLLALSDKIEYTTKMYHKPKIYFKNTDVMFIKLQYT